MNRTFPWDISFEGADTVQTHNFANVPMFHILYFAFYLGTKTLPGATQGQ